ncbi:MAG: UMP kinase [Firmicutes bacterium]|nr:UMP kinase [Candidatus Caballimonas caccae]
MKKSVYKRVIIKLSGEALAGSIGHGIDHKTMDSIVDQIIAVHNEGVEIGIIVGAGNFWRGRQGTEMDRCAADHMGMLATVLNAIALQDALERKGVKTIVQTSLEINRVAEPYSQRSAIEHLQKGNIVIFACGTGNPFFTTDTGAALKACELYVDALLLAKNVDGIYDSDPKLNKNARKYDNVTYKEYIEKGLKGMDTTAITLCMENNIPVLAFGLFEENALLRAVSGEKFGTLIKD